MNRTETVQALAYLSRAGAVYVVEGQVDVWADALADVPADAALGAVREIVRTRTSSDRPVVPGDIRARAIPARKTLTVDDLRRMREEGLA